VKLSEVGGCKQPPGVARDIYHFGPGEGIEVVKNRRHRGDAGETLDAKTKRYCRPCDTFVKPLKIVPSFRPVGGVFMIGSKYLLPLQNTKVVHLLAQPPYLGDDPGGLGWIPGQGRGGTGCRSGRILTHSSPLPPNPSSQEDLSGVPRAGGRRSGRRTERCSSRTRGPPPVASGPGRRGKGGGRWATGKIREHSCAVYANPIWLGFVKYPQ